MPRGPRPIERTVRDHETWKIGAVSASDWGNYQSQGCWEGQRGRTSSGSWRSGDKQGEGKREKGKWRETQCPITSILPSRDEVCQLMLTKPLRCASVLPSYSTMSFVATTLNTNFSTEKKQPIPSSRPNSNGERCRDKGPAVPCHAMLKSKYERDKITYLQRDCTTCSAPTVSPIGKQISVRLWDSFPKHLDEL